MDSGDYGWVIAGGALLWNIVVTVNSTLASRRTATQRDHTALEQRVISLEQMMKSVPTAENFHALDLAVTEIRGSMNTLAAEFKPTAKSVSRIEEWLLSARK